MSEKKRTATADEKELFERVYKEARPLIQPPGQAAPRKPVSKQTDPSGVDGGTADRLRRGLLEPQAKLDLHGYTESAAHGALLKFLTSAHRRGQRLVLVVTGKGGAKPESDTPFDMELDRRSRGVLKSAVPRWLGEPELVGLVASTATAHRKHGGAGALYIYLRKPQ